MENQTYSGGQIYTFSSTPGPMAPVLKDEFPEIELSTRITWGDRSCFNLEKKVFMKRDDLVDQDFILMHTFPLAKGDMNSCLKDIHSIVISKAMAKKFFGDSDPIGKATLLLLGFLMLHEGWSNPKSFSSRLGREIEGARMADM